MANFERAIQRATQKANLEAEIERLNQIIGELWLVHNQQIVNLVCAATQYGEPDMEFIHRVQRACGGKTFSGPKEFVNYVQSIAKAEWAEYQYDLASYGLTERSKATGESPWLNAPPAVEPLSEDRTRPEDSEGGAA